MPQISSEDIWRAISQECPVMSQRPGLQLDIPVWALKIGLVSKRRIDEVRLILTDVSKAGVVGGCVRSIRPIVDVGYCRKGLSSALYCSGKLIPLCRRESWSWVCDFNMQKQKLEQYLPRVIWFLLSSLKPCNVFMPLCSRLDIIPSFTGQ